MDLFHELSNNRARSLYAFTQVSMMIDIYKMLSRNEHEAQLLLYDVLINDDRHLQNVQ